MCSKLLRRSDRVSSSLSSSTATLCCSCAIRSSRRPAIPLTRSSSWRRLSISCAQSSMFIVWRMAIASLIRSLLLMCVILPLFVRSVKLEGESCGCVVGNLRPQLRVELREGDPQIVKLGLRGVQLVLELHLALEELADLALDLATFLNQHLAQHLLAKLCHRHDRARTTRTLAGLGGGIVCTVVVALAHAIIIPMYRMPSTTLAHKSTNISHFECKCWRSRGLGAFRAIGDGLWITLSWIGHGTVKIGGGESQGFRG